MGDACSATDTSMELQHVTYCRLIHGAIIDENHGSHGIWIGFYLGNDYVGVLREGEGGPECDIEVLND